MNQHPYLRAYMAGIVVPTAFLLVAMTVFTIARYVYNVPLPIERLIVFPMALVPNLWGLWNILYISLAPQRRRRLSIGLFGAALPFLLAPLGYLLTHVLDFAIPLFVHTAFLYVFPVGVLIYYLAWKFLVASLNAIVELV